MLRAGKKRLAEDRFFCFFCKFFLQKLPFFTKRRDIYYVKKYIFVLWQQLIYILRLVAAILGNGQNCAVCEASCRVVPVCEKCEKTYFSVRTISFGICRVCGKRLVSENEICTECRKSSVLQHTDGVFPLFSYRLWNIDLLCRWKMQEERQLSPFFAGKLASRLRELSNYFPDFAVIPVPPRPGKIRREGWARIFSHAECCMRKWPCGTNDG